MRKIHQVSVCVCVWERECMSAVKIRSCCRHTELSLFVSVHPVCYALEQVMAVWDQCAHACACSVFVGVCLCQWRK